MIIASLQVNQAEGRAAALKTEAIGKAEALRAVAEQIKKGGCFSRVWPVLDLIDCMRNTKVTHSNASSPDRIDGLDAASLTVAEQYVKAFSKLAKQNNTLILSNNVNDISSMVTQAMSIYKTVSNENKLADKPKFIDGKDPEYYSD